MIKCDHPPASGESIKVSQCTDAAQRPTKQITLTKGAIALVSDVDADLGVYNWYEVVRNERLSYVQRLSHKNDDGKWEHEYLHRAVMERVVGRALERREHVDHISGNGLDNTRENLRIVNYNQNYANARLGTDNTSGYKGVWWNKRNQRWYAQIVVNYKKIHLGGFKSKHDAARAYNAKALELHGEYARLNVIDESGETSHTEGL